VPTTGVRLMCILWLVVGVIVGGLFGMQAMRP
jgi:hypothetical protein